MRRTTKLAPLAAALVVLTACGGSGGGGNASTDVAGGEPKAGGELTVLEDAGFAGSWPTGLDPATNTTGGANLDMNQAVYGGLFLLEADDDGSNAGVRPNQAESLTMSSDNKTMTLKLKDGITFSDGTPLDAQAVVWNWQRDMTSTCSCKPQWRLDGDPSSAITVVDPLTVQVKYSQPFGTALSNFPVSNVNWIASPAAVQKQGPDDFKVNPVGAGPFTVVTNQLSSSLVLQKNPAYFKKGLPYLDKLTFQTIGGDQPAYQALQAGQGQAYIGLATAPLLDQAQSNSQLQTTVMPATSPYVVQLNTQAAPFDNPKARQAIYAATDWNAITKGLFKGKYPVSESFTAPGGLFYHKDVDGYQDFDLAKAKQLVQEVGGITITLRTTAIYTATQVMTALQTQWEKAGIKVEIEGQQLNQVIQSFTSGNWSAFLQTAGAWDPAAGVGVAFRFSSTAPFSGVKDTSLDDLLNQASATSDATQRDELYQQAAEKIAQNWYAPFGLAFAPANIAAKGVHGPGLTTKVPALAVNTQPMWDRVWKAQS